MAVLDVQGVTKQYRRGPLANDDISLSVEAGEVFGLLGPNGAGKTTLVSQILGLARPTAGRIVIDGVDAVRSPAAARAKCSYQPQATVPIEGLTPSQAVDIAGRIHGGRTDEVQRRRRELLEAFDLTAWDAKRQPLSGGVARLVAFCMAAVTPGRVVILDEPTNDVDPLRRRALWVQVRALADVGHAVLLVTHNVLEAERCVDRLAVVDGGRVVATGTPAALKANLGAPLRLELVLEPEADPPPAPSFSPSPVTTGRRVYLDVDLDAVSDAVAWARRLQEVRTVAEFALGPASLEDVYVRSVGPDADTEELTGAPSVG